MPHRNNSFVSGGYYHIYNRALDGQALFGAERDYVRCLWLIKQNARRYEVSVIAYCLMPTHYHLILRQDGEMPVSRFVQTVFNAYVQAVNKVRERRGPLFEGRFRCRVIEDDEYLLQVCRYIHLNPVKAELVASPGEWPFSNYAEWVGERNGTLVDQEVMRELAEAFGAYAAFVAAPPPPEGPPAGLHG